MRWKDIRKEKSPQRTQKRKIATEDTKKKMKATACFILVVAFMACPSTIIIERSDSLKLKMVSEEFIQKRQQWLSHFDYKFPIKQNEWCVDTCFYGIMPLRTWVRMSQNKLSEDSTLVVLHYSWQEDYYNSIVDYRARNVTYTLKQECGLDSALGRHINEKSYLAWAGLDLLNIGLASLYAHYDNPYLKSNIFINCGLILCDAALTVGLFLPNKPVRTGCLVGWSIYKVCGIMFCLPIHEHNKLAKTEYKFIFP